MLFQVFAKNLILTSIISALHAFKQTLQQMLLQHSSRLNAKWPVWPGTFPQINRHLSIQNMNEHCNLRRLHKTNGSYLKKRNKTKPEAKLEQAKSCNICYLQLLAVIIFVLKPHCYNNSEDNHGDLADHKYTELSWKSKASKFDQANQPDIAPELLLNCSQESFCKTHASWELLFYSSCLWIPAKEANQP